jgi:sugar lactone lactonase YvrE
MKLPVRTLLSGSVRLLALLWIGQSQGQPATPSYRFITIAGNSQASQSTDGTGSAARFNQPWGAAVDAGGNLYLADSGNNTIRLISPSVLGGQTNWMVSTIAGTAGSSGSADGTNGAAWFSRPAGIARDRAGNLYVADSQNATIRKLAPNVSGGQTNWVVTTIAGLAGSPGNRDGTNNAARFTSPAGLAVDSAGVIYVADPGTNALRLITPSVAGGQTNWVVSTITNTSQTPLRQPQGIAVDSGGNVYVADTGNQVIWKITYNSHTHLWVFRTVAGSTGTAGSADGINSAALFSSPQALVVDTASNVLVADTVNSTLRKISPSGANWVVSTIAGLAGVNGAADGTNSGARFNNPRGLALDAAGNVFVSDTANSTVRKVAPGGGANWVVSTLAGQAPSAGSEKGTNSASGLAFPSGLAADPSGTFYLTDTDSSTIRQVSASGETNWTVSIIAGAPGSVGSADGNGSTARFYYPSGLAIDGASNLFVADTANQTIRKLTPPAAGLGTNWTISTVAGSAGNIGSADGTNSEAQFQYPSGLAADAAGNLFVADTYNCTIRRLTPSVAGGRTNWVVTTIAGQAQFPGSVDGTDASARLSYPSGITMDSAGSLYVTDSGANTVRMLTPSLAAGQIHWAVSTIAGLAGNTGSADGTNSDARFNNPNGIAVDIAGNLYVADTGNQTLRKLTRVVPGGQGLWAVTTIGGLAGSIGDSDGLGSAARFYSPYGIALGPGGNVCVTDAQNAMVRLGRLLSTGVTLAAPLLTAGQVRITLNLAAPFSTDFQLWSARSPTGPWTLNSAALLTTNLPGVSYTFSLPLPADPALFYRVSAP